MSNACPINGRGHLKHRYKDALFKSIVAAVMAYRWLVWLSAVIARRATGNIQNIYDLIVSARTKFNKHSRIFKNIRFNYFKYIHYCNDTTACVYYHNKHNGWRTMTDTLQSEPNTQENEPNTQERRSRLESLASAARDLDMPTRSLEQYLLDRGYPVFRFGHRTKKVAVEDIAALMRAAKQPAAESA